MLEDTGEDKDYKKVVEKLTAHFSPQVNTRTGIAEVMGSNPLKP